jgi:hypothetical protein
VTVYFLAVITIICATSSWGFAVASVTSFQNQHKGSGIVFAAVSLTLGVGAILVWLFYNG